MSRTVYMAGSLLNDLYAHWPLDESSGTRAKSLGDAASADLSEIIGSVTSTDGYQGNAILSTYASTSYLKTSSTAQSLAAGFTFACRFTSISEDGGGGSHVYQNLLLLRDMPSGNLIRVVRHRTVGAESAGWISVVSQIDGDTNATDDVGPALISTRDDWHYVIVWYDPDTGKLYLTVDGNATVESTLYDGVSDLSGFSLNEVNLALPSTWDAWDGKIDNPAIWYRPLTSTERARWADGLTATTEQTFVALVQEDLSVGTSNVWVSAPGRGKLYSTQIGLHTFARGKRSYDADWTPGAITATGKVSTTVPVANAAVGDIVLASHSKLLTNDLRVRGHISAAGTATVVIHNPTSAAITVPSGTVRVIIFPFYTTGIPVVYDPLAGSFTAVTSGAFTPGAGLLTLTPTITGGSGTYTYAWSAWTEHGGSEGTPAFIDSDEVGEWTPLYDIAESGICNGEAKLIVTDSVTLLTLELGPQSWTWQCV